VLAVEYLGAPLSANRGAERGKGGRSEAKRFYFVNLRMHIHHGSGVRERRRGEGLFWGPCARPTAKWPV
jgi:hypothetical protein